MAALALLAVLAGGGAAAGDRTAVGREVGIPRIVNFAPREAAPWVGHQSWATAQDSRGVMYFGNTAGLVEYDGVSWRLLPLQPAGTVRSLARDAAGRIWVGGQGTFGTVEPDAVGQLRYRDLLAHVPPDQRDFTDVWKTHATATGIYFQAFTHLFRWADERLTVWRPETTFHMSFVVRGRVYVREGGRGLLRVEGDALRPVPHGEVFADDRVYVMLEHGDDEILVGTREHGLQLLSPLGVRPFPTDADRYLAVSQLYDGTRLADGSYALATLRGGVVLLDAAGHVLHVLDRARGVRSSTVTSVFADDSGGLWLTLDRDLSRVELPAAFTLFGETSGLEGLVQSVHRHRGELYAATTLGVYQLSPPRPTPLEPAPVGRFVAVKGLASQAWSLASAADTLLAATTDGVYQIDGLAARRIADGRALTLLPSVAVPGRVFVGLLDGLAVLDRRGDGWRLTPVASVRDEIRSIVERADGVLLLGGRYRGVWRAAPPSGGDRDWQVATLDEDAGLPLGHGRTQVVDLGGRVLVGTGAGLCAWNDSRQRFEPAREFGDRFAAAQTTVSELHVDPAGRLWLVAGPDIGLGVLQPTASGWSWNGAPFRHFGPRAIWGLLVEADGVVWICTSSVLVRYDPRVERQPAPEVGCLIREVRTLSDGAVLDRGGYSPAAAATLRHRLPFERNSLRFEFAAPFPGAEGLVEYQTRLGGFDRDWSAWGPATQREVTNLPPGRYRFEARGRTGGVVSREASVQLEIAAPWYRTWWALSTFLALGAAAFVGTVRWQVRRTRRVERARAENRRRGFELQRAQRIQRQMLPPRPPDVPWLDIAAVQHSATEVGGDYYDFFPQPDGTLFAAVGDATGHGLGAGLMVAATRTALLTVRDVSIAEVAATLNRVLRRVNLGARLNMALTLVELRPPDGAGRVVARATGGGMAPMYVLRRGGEVEEVVVAGVPLGALAEPEYGVVEVLLAAGDCLVLMSDGIAERCHPTAGPLGFAGVAELLAAIGDRTVRSPAPLAAHEVLGSIVDGSELHSDGSSLEDDITVVVMRCREQGAAQPTGTSP